VRWTNNINLLKLVPTVFFREQLFWHVFHLCIIAVVTFLVVLSGMSWLHGEMRPEVQVQASVHAIEKKENRRAESDNPLKSHSIQEYRRSIAEDLFGAVQQNDKKNTTEKPLDEIPLSEKDLHLRLVGTIVRDEPEQNIAVIEDTRSGDQNMYQAGDQVGQVGIESVLRDNVVITSSGEKRVLTMQFKRLRHMRGRKKSKIAASDNIEQSSASRSISKDFVLQSLQDMSGLMQSALIKPYQQNGKTMGFQLDNIRSGSFYDRIGLKDNDVILRIDNTDLKSPQQFMEFSRKLRNKDRITMTLRRGGEKRRIQYRLQ